MADCCRAARRMWQPSPLILADLELGDGGGLAEHHACDLRPHVYKRRPQGCVGHQRAPGRFVKASGGIPVAMFTFVLPGVVLSD
jgi:hypothetical protein